MKNVRRFLERFNEKVDRSGGPDACWPWMGATNNPKRGRPSGTCSERSDGIDRKRTAHSVAWETANGPAPDGSRVVRVCENALCCNHAHMTLEAGSRGAQHRRRPLAERFEEKIDRSGGPDACHLWTASCNATGYGQVWTGDKNDLASRVAWELANGPIPPETPWVLHNCPTGDNPTCVNTAHLWLGTPAQNTADAVAKNRHAHGDTQGASRLRDDQVIAIRTRVAAGEAVAVIASELGINVWTAHDVASRRTWRHLP